MISTILVGQALMMMKRKHKATSDLYYCHVLHYSKQVKARCGLLRTTDFYNYNKQWIHERLSTKKTFPLEAT